MQGKVVRRAHAWTWTLALPVILAASLLLCLAPLSLHADVSNKRTKLTFSGPVEVGGIALPAGTYEFRVMDTNPRTVVGIWNADGKFISFVMGIPNYRLAPEGRTVIRFSETGKGSPAAVREWFYPGDQFGLEFVYPESHAERIARASGVNVLSMPEKTAHTEKALEAAPVTRETPSGKQIPNGGSQQH